MKYFKSNNGKNCPEDQIITTENVCKDAATEIGLAYKFAVAFEVYPAGCFWHSAGGVYFNQITDPSQTDLTNDVWRENSGGLCMTPSKA